MRIKSESDIVTALADDVTSAISEQVISALDKHDTMTGDDSGLSNVWEEVCVQIQGEHSNFWSAYDDMVYAYVHDALAKRPVYQQIAVWLQTPAGIDEYYDDERDPDEVLAYDTGAAANSVVSHIYAAASDYSNEAIEEYLAG